MGETSTTSDRRGEPGEAGGCRAPAGATSQIRVDAASVEFFRSDPSRLETLGHPLRMRILREAGHREISAKGLSEDLAEPISKVSYHVKVLAEAGFLEVVRRTPRRGAIETHYRAVVTLDIGQDTWESAAPDLRKAFMVAGVQTWMSDMIQAVEDGGFETDEAIFGSAHFEADRQGMHEIQVALSEHYERLQEIEAGIRDRRARDAPSQGTPVNVGFALYEGARRNGRNGPFYFGNAQLPLIPEIG